MSWVRAFVAMVVLRLLHPAGYHELEARVRANLAENEAIGEWITHELRRPLGR